MSSSRLHPTVIWGQRKDFIFLRIMLQSCEVLYFVHSLQQADVNKFAQKPDFLITEDQIDFKGTRITGKLRKKLTFLSCSGRCWPSMVDKSMDLDYPFMNL